ncbi:hypothetical protein R3P38DRAFT_2771327 [Favolaschia claudopus]|uniref:Uncharacterized protein n=1 Tax=Favolaschia claudopus TaxID=2862362 RepID=A0AAW0C8J2_9AGAR
MDYDRDVGMAVTGEVEILSKTGVELLIHQNPTHRTLCVTCFGRWSPLGLPNLLFTMAGQMSIGGDATISYLTTRTKTKEGKWIGCPEVKDWNSRNIQQEQRDKAMYCRDDQATCLSCKDSKMACDRKAQFLFESTCDQFFPTMDLFLEVYDCPPSVQSKTYQKTANKQLRRSVRQRRWGGGKLTSESDIRAARVADKSQVKAGATKTKEPHSGFDVGHESCWARHERGGAIWWPRTNRLETNIGF